MKQFIRKNIDIWEVFLAHYRTDEEIIFLYTSQPSQEERYSIIGRNPYAKVAQYHGEVTVNGLKTTLSFTDAVDKLRQELKLPKLGWPIEPELIGFVSYEQDPACFTAYDELFLFEHHTNILRIVQFEQTDKDYWFNGKEKRVPKIALAPPSIPAAVFIDQTRREYLSSIKKIQEYMAAGDIYVTNLTQQFEIWSDLSPIQVFEKMVTQIPAPFASFFQYPEWEMTQISSSVERFISIQDRQLLAKPIKGTITRGKTITKDNQLKEELYTSTKERAELLMITDLLRNDISRISEPFSLSVPKFAEIESFSHVHQLVTSIKSTVKKNLTFTEFITALFPGGSITGSPKKRAMEIIKEVEKKPRGIYTGMQGWISSNLDLDMNVVIRTLIFNGTNYQLGVGGGITYESNPESEFDEVLLKAQPFMNLFQIDNIPTQLFTTCRVENKEIINLSAHIERLKKQYHHFDLSTQLQRIALEINTGILRISTNGDDLFHEIRPLPNLKENYTAKLSSKNFPSTVLSYFKIDDPKLQKMYHQEVIQAKKEGYHDVLFHTNGYVSELSIGNFLAKRGEIYETPAQHALKGIALKQFSKKNPVIYKNIKISDLKNYDAFYMLNAARGLVKLQIDFTL